MTSVFTESSDVSVGMLNRSFGPTLLGLFGADNVILKTKITALGLAGVLALSGCSAVSGSTSGTESSSSSTSTAESNFQAAAPQGGMPAGGGPGGVDVDGVTTEEQLVELIQEAYGDASLDLHRGHQPVQDVLVSDGREVSTELLRAFA